MKNYKRFISYLYFYEAGRKVGNVGFARVETSDEIGKLTLHCNTKMLKTECRVYLLKRSKASILSKKIGTAIAHNGFLDLKLVFEDGKIEDSDFNLKETQGIVLMYSKDNYIAAKWDNSNFGYHDALIIEQNEEMAKAVQKETDAKTVSDLLEEEDKNEQVKAAYIGVVEARKDEQEPKIIMVDPSDVISIRKVLERKEGSEKSKKEVPKVPTIIEINQAKEPAKVEKSTEVLKEAIYALKDEKPKEEKEEAKSEIAKEEKLGEEENLKATIEDSQEMDETKFQSENVEAKVLEEEGVEGETQDKGEEGIAKEKEEGIAKEEEEGVVKEKEESIAKEKEKGKIEDGKTGEEGKIEGGIQAANYVKPDPNLWADHPQARAILNRFVRMYPFDDGEIAECVRLEPKDIGLLPMNAWVLGNNSFLLHSYCNFRHLLFAKKLTREGCVYLLMVPGAHNNREQQLAKMFGFEHFKCSRRRSIRDGEFGYWYVTISFE